MMYILKNPIVLAILVGLLCFILMTFVNTPAVKKTKKKKRKHSESYFENQQEVNILVALILCIGTWYVAPYIFSSSDCIEHASDITKGIRVPGISSEEYQTSIDILGTGIKFPEKIPPILHALR